MLHSPYPHAEIVSIDTSEAEKLPGVIGVMTYKNAPAWKTGVPAHRPVMSQHLRFVGDPVAAVAAETPQIAEEALELIKVEYKQLTPVYDVEDAIKDGAPESTARRTISNPRAITTTTTACLPGAGLRETTRPSTRSRKRRGQGFCRE